MPKLEQLLEMLNRDPDDAFLRYGVGMAYLNASQTTEAIRTFDEVLRRDPNYVPAYFMCGRAHGQAGDAAAARGVYERGIAVARRTGDLHAAGEMEAAMEELGAGQ